MRQLMGLAVLLAMTGVAAAQDAAGDVKRGGELMISDGCFQCHGTVGQGSIRTGPALTPNVIPFTAFTGQLRKPMDRMPVYTSVVLPDGDAADIYAYLKSLPRPPNPADIALLQQ